MTVTDEPQLAGRAVQKHNGRPRTGHRILAATITERNGNTITVADHVARSVRNNGGLSAACYAAGLVPNQGFRLLQTGRRAQWARERGETLNAEQKACLRFCEQVDEAQAEARLRAEAELARLQRGGIPQIVTTVKVERDRTTGAEVEVERTTRTTSTLPSERALMWWLERRFPNEYGPRVEVALETVAGEQRGDVAASAREVLAAKLDAIAERRATSQAAIEAAAGIIDTTGTAS